MCLGTSGMEQRHAEESCLATGPRLGMFRVTTLSVSKYLRQSQEQHISVITTHRWIPPCTTRMQQVQTTSSSRCKLTG